MLHKDKNILLVKFSFFTIIYFIGEVSEWFKVHRWKRCVQQCTAGSNPVFSAKKCEYRTDLRALFIWLFCLAILLKNPNPSGIRTFIIF